MSEATVEVPLNRGGELYPTEETIVLSDYQGENFAEVSQSPEIILNYDALESTQETFDRLQEYDIDEIIEVFSSAGKNFTGDGYEEWIENVIRATGRTRSSAERAGRDLEMSLKNMENYLSAQAPQNDINAYDSNFYQRSDNERVDFIPEAHNFGVISPSNHPVVQVIPLMGLAAKVPLIHRPSNDEPFTAHRLAKSLYEAGLPEDALYVLPGDRSLGHNIVTSTDKGVVFGSQKMVDKYREDPDVKTYGPGNSKMVVGRGYEDNSHALAEAEMGMMIDGGRGCINESQFILFEDSEDFAYRLAERALDADIRDPFDPQAEVPALPAEDAKQIDDHIERYIDQDGVTDVTGEMNPGRIVEKGGTTFLRPTVLHLDYEEFEDGSHPLFAELPFQYGAITEVPEDDLGYIVEDSLSVSLHTDKDEVVQQVRMEPTVEKVHLDESSCNLDPSKPHEGYIVDHLYKEKEFGVPEKPASDTSRGFVSKIRQLITI